MERQFIDNFSEFSMCLCLLHAFVLGYVEYFNFCRYCSKFLWVENLVLWHYLLSMNDLDWPCM